MSVLDVARVRRVVLVGRRLDRDGEAGRCQAARPRTLLRERALRGDSAGRTAHEW